MKLTICCPTGQRHFNHIKNWDDGTESSEVRKFNRKAGRPEINPDLQQSNYLHGTLLPICTQDKRFYNGMTSPATCRNKIYATAIVHEVLQAFKIQWRHM